MARARMVTNSICRDKTVNNLSDFACRLLFTWLITFTDCEGRTYGDPELVKSMVFPRAREIDADQVELYLQELNDAGLIVWYEARGDMFIWFPKFDKNQPGIRKDREPKSEIPPPPAAIIEDYIRKFAVSNPEDFRKSAGLREVKLKEEECGGGDSATDDPDLDGISYKPLEVVFRDKTGIYPPVGGGKQTQKWVEAFRSLQQQNATPEEISGTIGDMQDRGLNIAGPWSLLNPLNIYRSKNNRKPKERCYKIGPNGEQIEVE